MNKRQKVIASASLFIVLLLGAWFANERSDDRNLRSWKDDPKGFRLQQMNEDELDPSRPFAPREYIRIREVEEGEE